MASLVYPKGPECVSCVYPKNKKRVSRVDPDTHHLHLRLGCVRVALARGMSMGWGVRGVCECGGHVGSGRRSLSEGHGPARSDVPSQGPRDVIWAKTLGLALRRVVMCARMQVLPEPVPATHVLRRTGRGGRRGAPGGSVATKANLGLGALTWNVGCTIMFRR